jgi:hypothetical protein
LIAWLQSLGLEVTENDREMIKPLELDAWIPSKNIAIEYCGLHWHGELIGGKAARTKHIRKLKACEAKGIRLVTLFSDEWLTRNQQVKGYLQAILGLPLQVVGARECKIVQPTPEEVVAFLDGNHLQGSRTYSLAFALKSPTGLTAVLTATKYESGWDLNRYAIKLGIACPGGFQKLLKHFLQETKPEYTWTYADLRWSRGGLYEASGFSLEKTSDPAPWNFKQGKDSGRLHRMVLNKGELESRLGGLLPNETGWAAAQRLGYDRIWDCGHQKWSLDYRTKK